MSIATDLYFHGKFLDFMGNVYEMYRGGDAAILTNNCDYGEECIVGNTPYYYGVYAGFEKTENKQILKAFIMKIRRKPYNRECMTKELIDSITLDKWEGSVHNSKGKPSVEFFTSLEHLFPEVSLEGMISLAKEKS